MPVPLRQRVLAALVLVAALASARHAQDAQGPVSLGSMDHPRPPRPPVITEPPVDFHLVNGADVHMETAPMVDPDSAVHYCSGFEIRTVVPDEAVWHAPCVTGPGKVHTHLGDGVFLGSHAGRSSLVPETLYRLRVRHRDGSGRWSPWSQRPFVAAPVEDVLPLEVDDVVGIPDPRWVDMVGADVLLPTGGTPPTMRLENAQSELLLGFVGAGATNIVVNPTELEDHAPVRIVVEGGAPGLVVAESTLGFTDHEAVDRTIHLPALAVGSGATLVLWVASSGATYTGAVGQLEPDFSTVARGPSVPWRSERTGYQVSVDTEGFQLPVDIAFVPSPGAAPGDPRYYVAELYGAIRVVTNDGTVGTYASGLLDFSPTGNFPGSGEVGVGGICVDPSNGDLFATLVYDGGFMLPVFFPRVVRFESLDGGQTASSQTTVLDMAPEPVSQSHFVSRISFGPDGRLYVHVGDGFQAAKALDLDSFLGKILRLDPGGGAPASNPFFDALDGIGARDYVWAHGFRNPFGGDWWGGELYQVENGPAANDRLARVVPGVSYAWDGTPESLTTAAIYNWTPPHAPVRLAFVQAGVFGGSGFPASVQGHAFVTESGPTWASGPQSHGKRIVGFHLAPGGTLLEGPIPWVEYEGVGKATAAALAAGPDGLYFSDLYKDVDFLGPVDPGARVLRVAYVGVADFAADVLAGPAPLAVQFQDQSDVPGALAWSWWFGDGSTSSAASPGHVYSTPGTYHVRLEVTSDRGTAVEQKNFLIGVGSPTVPAPDPRRAAPAVVSPSGRR